MPGILPLPEIIYEVLSRLFVDDLYQKAVIQDTLLT